MKDKLLTILYIVLIIIVTLVLAKLCGKESEEDTQEIYQERIEQSQDDLRIVDSLLEAEIISFNSGSQFTYYNEDHWLKMSRKERKEITTIIAIYITNKLDAGIYWTNVYGMYTKKKLASWFDEPIGYKEYIFYEQSINKVPFKKLRFVKKIE